MPEGPSIALLREELQSFEGRRVLAVEGNTRTLDLARLRGRTLREVLSYGKQLILDFDAFALRVHFGMYGRWAVDERREGKVPRAQLRFARGREINLYGCSVRWLEGDWREGYDWAADVLSDDWDARAARRKLRAMPEACACDVLLDQSVFAGVGNIIKNEVLYRIRLHPLSRVGALPTRKLGELVAQARAYSFDFLEWKRNFVLRKHWLAHTQRTCRRCELPLTKAWIGKTQRRSFFCENCQRRYR